MRYLLAMSRGWLMLHHVSIGVRNSVASKRFYDAVLQPLGCRCLSEAGGWIGYGREEAAFWVVQSASPMTANAKSGLHFCFSAPSRKAVDDFHAAALAAGGQDNGAPGLRADYGDDYYAAFVVDPDGYRIEAYCNVR